MSYLSLPQVQHLYPCKPFYNAAFLPSKPFSVLCVHRCKSGLTASGQEGPVLSPSHFVDSKMLWAAWWRINREALSREVGGSFGGGQKNWTLQEYPKPGSDPEAHEETPREYSVT